MPIYQYNCECGEEFEAIRSIADRGSSSCPKCRELAPLVITPVNFDPKLGLDPDFATFSSQWAKKRERAARGK